MTDKVQKILSEIATRKLCTMDEHMAFYNDKAKEDYSFLSEIEEIIKDMQEEPVSEDLEKEFSRFLDEKEGMPRMRRSEEQLEWALDIARHFAEWQKEQMMKGAIETTLSKGLEEDYNIKGKYKAYIIVIKED